MFPYHLVMCCMTSWDYSITIGTLAMFVTSLFLPVPRAEWDALWTVYPYDVPTWQAVYFLRWGLEETFIIVDDVPVPAVGIVDYGWWLALGAWLITPAASCLDGCGHRGAWH